MKNSLRLSVLAIPALGVTGAALLLLLASVAGASSNSLLDDSQDPLRAPASQMEIILNSNGVPQTGASIQKSNLPIVAPTSQGTNNSSIQILTVSGADMTPLQISTERENSIQDNANSTTEGVHEIETEKSKVSDDKSPSKSPSSARDSGGSDDSTNASAKK